ncbi:ABC transporter permease [Janibacter hoylei]
MTATPVASTTVRHEHGERAPLRPVQRVAAVAAYFGLVYRRTWMGSVFSRFVMPLLFLLAMGVGLGSLVDDASGGVEGVSYLLFVAPAMIAVQAMMTAVSESTYPVYGLFTWNRMYHSMLATPLTVSDLLLGHLAVVAAQGGFAAAAFVVVAALFGSFTSWWVLLAVPIGVLVTLAFAVPLFGFTARAKGESAFNIVYRLVITPLMLFSGVFFPVDPPAGPRGARLADAPVARRGAVPRRGPREFRSLRPGAPGGAAPRHRGRLGVRPRRHDPQARLVSAGVLTPGLAMWRSVVERNVVGFRRQWAAFVTGFAEPVFYLLSLGIGVGSLVPVVLTDGGTEVSYAAFVAPAMLAASAMNGAIMDSTFNVFFKLRYAKIYDAMLATPLGPRDIAVGEVVWSLIRGGVYALVFYLVALAVGVVESWWSLLAVPAAVFIGLAFSAVGMFATTFMRSWVDFDWIMLVIQPLFLLSATFFPLGTYPGWAQPIVQATPLYHGVALERGLMLGEVGWGLLWHVGYLVVLGVVGIWATSRRIETLLRS